VIRVSRLKVSLIIALAFLSGCGWFHKGKPPVPDPTELIVTGAPVGSVLFVDGVQTSQPKEAGNRTQVVDVAPGAHTLEVRRDGTVAYRENTFVISGKKVVITVLAGDNRN
jgi:hypothetical protein